MKYTILFIYALGATYFATFEVMNRLEAHMYQRRGYEIVTMVKAPDGVERSYMQQARQDVLAGQQKQVTDLIDVYMPKVAGIN